MTLASRATQALFAATIAALSLVPATAAGSSSGGVGIGPPSSQPAATASADPADAATGSGGVAPPSSGAAPAQTTPTETNPATGDLAPAPPPAPTTTTSVSGGTAIPVSVAATSQPDTGVAVSGTLVATPVFATKPAKPAKPAKPVASVTKPVSSVLGVTVSRPRGQHNHPASGFCAVVESNWVAGLSAAVGGAAHTGGAGVSSATPSCLMPTGGAGLIG